MNATQFIQQHGVDKAREVVEGAPEKATVVSAETYGYFYKYQDSPVWCRVYRRKDGGEWSCTRFSPIINPIELSDLKRLVESVYHIGDVNDMGDDAALQLVNEMKGKRYPFSAYADQLEQALKGGCDEAK